MFTGIITETGTIISLTKGNPAQIRVKCPIIAPQVNYGDSVAVSGVCLTAVEIDSSSFLANISDETVQRSTLSDKRPGDPVNLELALAANGRFGGHIVQGHVDGLGSISSIAEVGTGWEISIKYPGNLNHYIVEKGSISIDGISLTIARINSSVFTVAIIPSTYKETTLHFLQVGDSVNLEVDILAKYVEKMLGTDGKKDSITQDFLQQHGYNDLE